MAIRISMDDLTTEPTVETLRKRSEFLACARALRKGTSSMMVQARQRHDYQPAVRVGYTCSKKVGNAVARNRAKRRLRAVAREIVAMHGQAGWDYVLIGRADKTGSLPYETLRRDLSYALRHFHTPQQAAST